MSENILEVKGLTKDYGDFDWRKWCRKINNY